MDNNFYQQRMQQTQSVPGAQGAQGQPIQQVNVLPVNKKTKQNDLIKLIVIISLSVLLAIFFGLFIWKAIAYEDASSNLNSKINIAVADALDENTTKLESEFAEREKYPYVKFMGPEDYGELSFEYPKTWNVYIESDTTKGGDFKAYFNPSQVDPISNTNINALRLTIRDDNYDTVVAEYEKQMNKKGINLSVEAIELGGFSANKYTGTIPGTEFNGYIVIFKIRDKTAVLQTDSVLFEKDFNNLLNTVAFNS